MDPHMNDPEDDERDARRCAMALAEFEAFDAQHSVHSVCKMIRFYLIESGILFDALANALQMDSEILTLMYVFLFLKWA